MCCSGGWLGHVVARAMPTLSLDVALLQRPVNQSLSLRLNLNPFSLADFHCASSFFQSPLFLPALSWRTQCLTVELLYMRAGSRRSDDEGSMAQELMAQGSMAPCSMAREAMSCNHLQRTRHDKNCSGPWWPVD